MPDLLSVNTIAFTILGYPLSYIELVGTLLYLWSVWLVVHEHMLTWPVSIVSVLLYMVLFYQIQLYSDTLEQVYYLVVNIYGWWRWQRATQRAEPGFTIRVSPPRTLVVVGVVTLVLSVALGALVSRVHLLAPALFPQPAAFPYLDALTTVMSFSAMWLLAQKRLESWGYWIIVDVIGIGLYYAQGTRFIAMLYVVLLVMAWNGLITWMRKMPLRAAQPMA